jgi:hypothetical protein
VRRIASSSLLLGAGILALSAACEAIVTDEVPAVSCLPGAAGACPDGQSCDRSSHTCIANGVAAQPDAGADGGVLPPLTGCSSLGCQCSSSQDCMSGLCGDSKVVTSAIYAAADKTSFCTASCCTSADCDAHTVCLGAGTGVNYCLRPEWLGRSAVLGSSLGGATCKADSDCRSGLCAMGTCLDVCCSTAQSAAECANGSTCQFSTFAGRSAIDSVYVPSCGAPGPGVGGTNTTCKTAADCRSALCTPDGRCHDACRNTADCGDPALECGYFFPKLSASQVVSACETPFGTSAHGAEGSACTGNSSCQSGFCDATSQQCTDVCYADSDCTAPGWRCRLDVTLMFGSNEYTVFACGM